MRLVDLDPHWLSPDVFVFRSPSGHGDWITCKRVPMAREQQYELVYRDNPQFVGKTVVMTQDDMVWSFAGNDFATLTVSPSIDHSPSGNWHGFVLSGEIR
jgi:hypothetical protein